MQMTLGWCLGDSLRLTASNEESKAPEAFALQAKQAVARAPDRPALASPQNWGKVEM